MTNIRSIFVPLILAICLPVMAGQVNVTGPITQGSKGEPFSVPTTDLKAINYVVEEFFFEGSAHAYHFPGADDKRADGRWRVEPSAEQVPYRSRILVVRPQNGDDFNGTAIVHWQNVTAGYELGTAAGEALRGYAWVGVSAQKIGVDGVAGPDAAGLKQWDPDRYGELNHPGDDYSYDIFADAGRVVGPARGKLAVDPMAGLKVERLIAAGASQSASRLRGYINALHPLDQVFSGYIPYLDFCSPTAFRTADAAQAPSRMFRQSTPIRGDLGVPVIVVNTETETPGCGGDIHDDTDDFRFWEVAGSSHVSVPRGAETPMASPNWLSFAPVYNASIRHMHNWLGSSVKPPHVPRITIVDGAIVRDEHGNAKGGIRLPGLAVPTSEHRGAGSRGTRFEFLYGFSRDFTADELGALYTGADNFMAKYRAAVEVSVGEGMVLREDVPELLQQAETWAEVGFAKRK